MLVRERNEHTIAERVQVTGRGYWSGQGITVRFLPAQTGTGIRFVRTDLAQRLEIPASMQTRSSQSLRTCLIANEARIEMVEHLLAALYGMEIDNCVVEVNGEELPGLDGSSAGYVHALRKAGLVMQAHRRKQIVVDRTLRLGDANHWIELAPSDDGRMHVEYRLDYGNESPIQPQSHRCAVTPDNFMRELAPARTFVTHEQAESLRARGVASHVTNRDLLVFGKNGPVDNLLRYPNECSRHKALDMVGDLSLVGADIIGCVTSHRGGHQLNGMLAEQISQLAVCVPAGCRKAA